MARSRAGGFVTVGGRVARQHLGTVEAWDPTTACLGDLGRAPTPRAGLGVTATCDGGLVAVGGEDIRGVADRTFPEVEAWDPVTGAWSSWVPLPEGRHGVSVASVGSTLLVIGGGAQAGLSASDTVEALDLTGRPGCGGDLATVGGRAASRLCVPGLEQAPRCVHEQHPELGVTEPRLSQERRQVGLDVVIAPAAVLVQPHFMQMSLLIVTRSPWPASKISRTSSIRCRVRRVHLRLRVDRERRAEAVVADARPWSTNPSTRTRR